MVLDKIQVKPEIDEDNSKLELDVLQTLEIPQNLYSAAMVLPLETFDAKKRWNQFIHAQTIFMLFVNFFIQGTLIGYLYYITLDNEEEYGECGGYWQTEQMVYRLCVLIYIAFCLADIIETLGMAYWYWMISRATDIKDTGMLSGNANLQYKIVDEDGDLTKDVLLNARKVHSTTICYKFYVFFGVLFPKFCLAAGTLLIGTGFIVNTDSRDNLLLNALALGFILEIDEMIYEFIASPQWQECVQTIPKIQVLGDETKAGFFKRFGVPLKALLFVGLTYLALDYWCPNSE